MKKARMANCVREDFGAMGAGGWNHPIDALRGVVNLFNNGRETVAQRFTVSELLNIYCAYKASDWDFHPDQWDAAQLAQAAKFGTVPQWDENEEPVYHKAG